MFGKDKRLIYTIMIFVLICLLFFSSVAFGQMSPPPPPPTTGNVSGYIFQSDGKTPLQVQNNASGFVAVFDDTTGLWVNLSGSSDSSGHYAFNNIAANGDNLSISVKFNNSVVGASHFKIIANTTQVVNVTTSRMLTN